MKKYTTLLYKAFRASADRMPEWIGKAVENGFQGVEITGPRNLTLSRASEFRQIAESNGIRIHSSSFGWVDLNDPRRTADDLEKIKSGLRIARACGADAILLVPGRIEMTNSIPLSKIDLEFNAENCMISRIVQGDNTPWQEYIRLQNQATEICFRALKQLIPVAAYEGVTIGIENVWNNLWITPELLAAFVRHFESPWIKVYFDLGNHLKYAPVERWLRVLGADLITKLHLKDFALNPNDRDGGKFMPLGHGDFNSGSVRHVLEEIKYSGWVSLEDVPNHYSLKEHSEILDRFFDGRSLLP